VLWNASGMSQTNKLFDRCSDAHDKTGNSVANPMKRFEPLSQRFKRPNHGDRSWHSGRRFQVGRPRPIKRLF
jgi:hypothetical protein